MDFQSEVVLSWLEEDNVQRAFYRLMPLLTVSGDARENAMALWPDYGALRIVPDKAEQGSFKDRMRQLGHFCLMDLTPFSADANKIRTNKNYRPNQGQSNRYILYSDTVKSIGKGPFYQLFDSAPDNVSKLAQDSITPWFMLQHEDQLYGPIEKANPQLINPASPFEYTTYTIIPPDEIKRVILCDLSSTSDIDVQISTLQDTTNKEEIKNEPCNLNENATDIISMDETLPIGETLEILDSNASFEETIQNLNQPVSASANLLKQQPKDSVIISNPVFKESLGGTPLTQKKVRISSQPAKNHVQEVISSQWKCAKNDPPTSDLPTNIKLQKIDNPIELAIESIQFAWNHTDSRKQLVNALLALPEAHAYAIPVPQNSKETILQTVLKEQLNDLEAERLIALVQLDRAKNDLGHFRKTVIDEAKKQVKADLAKAQKEVSEFNQQLASLRDEVNALVEERNSLRLEIDQMINCESPASAADLLKKAKMALPPSGKPIYLTGVSAAELSAREIFDSIQNAISSSYPDIDKNTIIAITTLLCVCDTIQIKTPSPAPLKTLVENFTEALGWSNGYACLCHEAQNPVYVSNGLHAAPILLLNLLDEFTPYPGAIQIKVTTPNHPTASMAYETQRWPVIHIDNIPFIPSVHSDNATPISLMALKDQAAHAECNSMMRVLQPIMNESCTVSGKTMKIMSRFAAICAKYMDGGLPAALDWTIALWLIPTIIPSEKMLTALAEYPISHKLLSTK